MFHGCATVFLLIIIHHDGKNGNRSFALFVIIFKKDIIIFRFSGIRKETSRIPT